MKIHEVYPYLHVHDAARAIEFYKAAFGATERMRLEAPDGHIGHAELAFGGATVMLADEFPGVGITAPATLKGTSFTVHLHVDDADAAVRRAVDAGAEVTMEPTDHFYGERTGVVRDPFGHRWTLGHSIEDVSPEEMQRRYVAGDSD